MGSLIDRAVELIKSEGFTGAHNFIFLTRYASLTNDKALLELVGNTLGELDSMKPDATLAYAYTEYFQAQKEEFSAAAADYILGTLLAEDQCSDRMLLPALAKAARVLGNEKYLRLAQILAEDSDSEACGGKAFLALGLLELYRATYSGEYLAEAERIGRELLAGFHNNFSPSDVYDIAGPSGNSAAAVLFDELARIFQTPRWKKARENQNRFISILCDKYPTAASFGMCALLSDEFEWKTVKCVLPTGRPPKELDALLSFYSPLTEFLLEENAEIETAEYYLQSNGTLEKLADA